GRRFQFQITAGQVIEYGLLLFTECIGATRIIVPKRRRFENGPFGKLKSISFAGAPFAMGCLVVAHEEEGFVPWPIAEYIDGKRGDHVSHIAGIDAVTLPIVEDGVFVASLAGQDVPVIEALRIRTQMPFAEHRSVIAGVPEAMGNSAYRRIDVVENWNAIAVAVLPGENCGPAWGTDGIHRGAVAPPQTLPGQSIHVR